MQRDFGNPLVFPCCWWSCSRPPPPDLSYQAVYSMTCFTVLSTCIDPHTWPGLHPHRLQKTVCPIILMSAGPDRVTHHSIVPHWHPSHWIKTCHLETRLSRLLDHRQPKSPDTGVDADILLLVPAKKKNKKKSFTLVCLAFFSTFTVYVFCGSLRVEMWENFSASVLPCLPTEQPLACCHGCHVASCS